MCLLAHQNNGQMTLKSKQREHEKIFCAVNFVLFNSLREGERRREKKKREGGREGGTKEENGDKREKVGSHVNTTTTHSML